LIDLSGVRPLGLPQAHYDLDAVVAGLRATAASWAPSHFRNGRQMGDELRLANIRGDKPRKQGSCVIALEGERAGDWIDFDDNQGGGPLSTLEHATGLTGRALIEYAAELAGSAPVNGARHPIAETLTKEQRAENTAREIELILARATPLGGTAGETYLAGRGLQVPDTPDLLFHPDLTYWDTRTGYPALVAIVRDVEGEQIAIHRTYLAPDSPVKADVPTPRMMLGSVASGALRLGEIGASGVVGLGEGIETALSVAQACPELPVWAALASGNLEQVVLPPEVTRVVILADNDGEGVGLKVAERAAGRFHAEGRRVWFVHPPDAGDDFNDLLLKQGLERVRQVVEAAAEWQPAPQPPAQQAQSAAPELGTHRALGFRGPTSPLPQMRADDGDLARITNRSWSLLLASNAPTWLYRCGGGPSWVERDNDRRPVPRPMTEDRLRHVLAQLVNWRKRAPNGDLVPAYPPPVLLKNLLATPDPALPVLAGIVTAPVFGNDGTLITEPGYHPAARLLYEPAPGFQLAVIPERPTSTDIAAARSLLLDDLLGEFPFVSEAERSHALALLLLPFVRPMVSGPTPLHMVEKPAPGTGATLMVDAISIIATGTSASVMVEGRDEDEWRKRLTAKLREIPSILLIDNLRRQLDASSVAAALTAPYWEDRVLGKSEMTRFPIRCVWIATGNNPQFSNEIARRMVRIRLDPHEDQPWLREGFRHPNLLAWVWQNRARLVAACLTLGRAWIAAGRPRHQKTIGSFEGWAEVMGGILEVAGVPGFLGNLKEMYERADAEGAVWRVFVGLWWQRFGTAEVGSSDLYELATASEPPLPLGDAGERSQRTRLGKALGRMRDRVFAVGDLRLRITGVGVEHQARRWQLVLEDHGRTDGSAPGGERGERSPAPSEGVAGERHDVEAQRSPQRSPEKTTFYQCVGERGERGERFSFPYACAHARAMKDTGKPSPPSQRSPNPGNPRASAGEHARERPEARSPAPEGAPNGHWEELI
jgi:putative DNA primase/helicase